DVPLSLESAARTGRVPDSGQRSIFLFRRGSATHAEGTSAAIARRSAVSPELVVPAGVVAGRPAGGGTGGMVGANSGTGGPKGNCLRPRDGAVVRLASAYLPADRFQHGEVAGVVPAVDWLCAGAGCLRGRLPRPGRSVGDSCDSGVSGSRAHP